MVHQRFDTSTVYYDDYVQVGGGETYHREDYYRGGPVFQRGYGIQRGSGVGDVFKGIWRFFIPILRRIGTAVGEEAVTTGHRVLDQIKEGKPVKETVITEGKRGIDNVLEQGGFPKQFGTGRHRRRQPIKRKTQSHVPTHQTVIGSAISKPLAHSRKRLKSDIFGLY